SLLLCDVSVLGIPIGSKDLSHLMLSFAGELAKILSTERRLMGTGLRPEPCTRTPSWTARSEFCKGDNSARCTRRQDLWIPLQGECSARKPVSWRRTLARKSRYVHGGTPCWR